MNNLSKVILAIVAGILLYFAFHILVALLSIAVWIAVVVILVYAYNRLRRKQKNA
jgi:hypothetical protein